jgi:hypothetical protein
MAMKPKKEKYFFEYEKEAKLKKEKAMAADKKALTTKPKSRDSIRGYIAPAKPKATPTAKPKATPTAKPTAKPKTSPSTFAQKNKAAEAEFKRLMDAGKIKDIAKTRKMIAEKYGVYPNGLSR